MVMGSRGLNFGRQKIWVLGGDNRTNDDEVTTSYSNFISLFIHNK